MRLADPFWLVFLAAAGLPWAFARRRPRVAWPTLDGFTREPASRWAVRLAAALPLARSLAIACMAVALARPQTAGEQVRISGRGVAVALVLDRSSSMKTADFPAGDGPITRLDAAKVTLGHFLEARADDLIGAVAFAALPDTIAPPTLDRRFTWQALRAVRPAGAADDGTDIGGAIAWGLDMLRPAPTQRKALILLTDGRHAPGAIRSLDPLVAAEVARGLGVTVHTVAVGRPTPPTPGGEADAEGAAAAAEGPDLDLLRRLAERGNGRAFVAADLAALDGVFAAIDALETSPLQGTIQTVYRERFAPWVAAALAFAALDLVLAAGRFRRLP